MRRQLLLDLWDDPGCAALWEGLPSVQRARVVDLYTHLALRAARGAPPTHADVETQPEDGQDGPHDRRTDDERITR